MEEEEEGRSLFETPTWAVATVITAMVSVGFLVHGSLKRFGKWLISTRRKALLAALEKIKEELMLFGLLSLLMGHWSIWVSKICVKSSAFNSRFYPCTIEGFRNIEDLLNSSFNSLNHSAFPQHKILPQHHCPEGHEPFASYESLEQLHRLLFVLGIVHVCYNFATVALAMLKIQSWNRWENRAKSMVASLGSTREADAKNLRRLSTFIFHHTSHPWSQNRVLVWVLCFSRQFWSSINRADYMALRLGFITNHDLHLSYNFHSYMLRSMEDEFRCIVGISIPLWMYAILCIFLNFHGTNAYFWLSFIPPFVILLIGTKLHHVVLKLALETMVTNPCSGNQINLRDELFWFGKPKLLLWLIQLISFQNAFEMATFIWSLWEIKGPSCFIENRVFLIVRLISGIIFQFWCSYITFPLYVIVTQMGSKFKKSVLTENVRDSLYEWRRRAKKLKRRRPFASLVTATSTASLDSLVDEITENDTVISNRSHSSFSRLGNIPNSSNQPVFVVENEILEHTASNVDSCAVVNSRPPLCDSDEDNDGDEIEQIGSISFSLKENI